jgi:hypothetical protein
MNRFRQRVVSDPPAHDKNTDGTAVMDVRSAIVLQKGPDICVLTLLLSMLRSPANVCSMTSSIGPRTPVSLARSRKRTPARPLPRKPSPNRPRVRLMALPTPPHRLWSTRGISPSQVTALLGKLRSRLLFRRPPTSWVRRLMRLAVLPAMDRPERIPVHRAVVRSRYLPAS